MIRSRDPNNPTVGAEINFGSTGYTFPSSSDTYELEIHFSQPFTMKYVFIPNSANIDSFRVDGSHAGMLGVFSAKNTQDGLVVDGFPPMLISMLLITITQTTDGRVPSQITLNIVSARLRIVAMDNWFVFQGVCNPIYSPSNVSSERSASSSDLRTFAGRECRRPKH